MEPREVPALKRVELRFQKTKVAGIRRDTCLRREKKGHRREDSGEDMEGSCLRCGNL